MARSAATPALTVAMSVYNNAAYVGQAIDSMCAQGFGDFEFLIVNDGSTDGSAEVIDSRAARDPRIRAIHQENRGFIASLNRMFAEARAPWVARMDGDDVSLPDRLGRQMDFLARHPEVGVLSCEARLVGPDGAELTDRERRPRPLTHEDITADMANGIAINHNAAVMNRDAVRAIGGYHQAYRHCEDYDIWLRLIGSTRLANIPDTLIDYRIYPEQVSSRHVTEQARNAAIAWAAYQERAAGRPDPTEALDTLPPLDRIDALFGREGVAAHVRRKVVERTLFSAEALGGDAYPLLLDYIRETGAEPRIWRVAARLLKAGRVPQAAGVARALLAAG